MALIGHLDLVRLFDRAIRRASLPVSFTGGYHPGPRISPANALPLGATSSGEVVDFDLKTKIDPEAFRQRLASELPEEVPLYQVIEVPLSSPSATKSLQKAEYIIRLAVDSESPEAFSWSDWIEAVKAQEELLWEKTTKSGKLKTLNLREWLYQLELLQGNSEGQPVSGEKSAKDREAVVRFVGSSRNDGTLLRPEQVAWMISQVAQQPVEVQQVHRQRLIFADLLPSC
jgi:radical SAM-linked protein